MGLRQINGWQRKVDKDGKTIGIWLRCPGCLNSYELDHEISADGVVTPSLDCPNPDCNFHEMVQLADWVVYGP